MTASSRCRRHFSVKKSRLEFPEQRQDWAEGLGGGDVLDVDVPKNRDTPKSSILIGFSIINHPFWGTPIFGNIHILDVFLNSSYA